MDKKLVSGMIVKVYEDPITCEKLEGKAFLHKFISLQGFYNDAELSLWQVKSILPSDNYTYSRTINSVHNWGDNRIMNSLNVYADHSKRYIIYNQKFDDDLRCITVQHGKVIKSVSLTLSSFDRLCFLDRLPEYKGLIQFD